MKRALKKFRNTRAATAIALVLIWLLALLVKAWARTLRVHIEDPAGFLGGACPNGAVIAIWHNRLVFVGGITPHRFRRNGTVIVSQSRDGLFAAMYSRRFLGGVIRGSTSRGGTKALLQLRAQLKAGKYVVLTVDGPRGPRYRVQPGAVALAGTTGAPIVPICVNAPKRWELRSWDRTQFPKPFSRVSLVFGRPIVLPDGCDLRTEGVEVVRRRMLEVTDDSRPGGDRGE